MKKLSILNALLSSMLLSAYAYSADSIKLNPAHTQIDISCPISLPGEPNTISNFGDYIAGYGQESLLSRTQSIYFTSESNVPDAPIILVDYYNESVSYNSIKGTVSCYFQSIIPTDPRFSIFYQLTNGQGGTVISQTSNAISILLPIG